MRTFAFLTLIFFMFFQSAPLSFSESVPLELNQERIHEIDFSEVQNSPNPSQPASTLPLTFLLDFPLSAEQSESTTIIGYVDVADLNGVRGWAVEGANRSLVLEVEVLVNGVVKAKRSADASRPDLVSAGVAPDPNHGYVFSLRDLGLEPGTYQIQVQGVNPHTGDKKILTNTKTLTIASNLFPVLGYLDAADIDGGISGWAVSQNSRGTQLEVEILVDGQVQKTVLANKPRSDLVAVGIAPDPNHGYAVAFYELALTPGTHTIQVRAIDPVTGIRRMLTNSKSLTIPDALFPAIGYFDGADWQNGVRGWAVNQAAPGTQLQVEILVNGEVKKTVLANQSRPDLVAAGVAPDPNHGFRFSPSDLNLIPGTYTVQARAIDAASNLRKTLIGSFTLIVPQFLALGYLDEANTTQGIKGWAVNQVHPSQQLVIEVLVNGEIKATVIANQSRPDLVAAGVAPDPNHGYSIPILNLGLSGGTYTIQSRAVDPLTGSKGLLTNTKTLTITIPTQPSLVSVTAGDRRLFVQERRFDGSLAPEIAFVGKGVNWSPHTAGTSEANLHLEFANWYATDIPLMAQMGINVVRVYHDFGTGPDAFAILDKFYQYGIKVIMEVDSPRHGIVADMNNITAVVNAYKNHPAILMWSIGNEWDINRYYGSFDTLGEAAQFTEQAAQQIKAFDPNHPVATVMADPHIPGYHPLSKNYFPYLPSDYYTDEIVNTLVPSVDVWILNVYRNNSFGDVFQQWKSISEEPMLIGEFGADSYDHRTANENEAMQSKMIGGLWDEVYFDLSATRINGVAVGSLAFEWNDEWWKNGTPASHTVTTEGNPGQPDGFNDEEWFGIVDIHRNPKNVYSTLQDRFVNGNVEMNATPFVEVTSGPTAIFKIEDKTVFSRAGRQWGARGINVAILDHNTGIRMIEISSFDTWISQVMFSSLIGYLNSFPDGTIFLFSVADEGGFVDTGGNPRSSESIAGYEAMEALGSTKVHQVLYNGGWAMITIKGQGVIAEGVSAPHQSVTIGAELSLTLDPDQGLRTPLPSLQATPLSVREDLPSTHYEISSLRSKSTSAATAIKKKKRLRR